MTVLDLLAASPVTVEDDTVYVYLSAERLDVYPPQYVADIRRTSSRVTITTTDGHEHVYRLSLIDSVSSCPPDSLPRITSFKFNNKYNDQVFTDAVGDITGDSLITVTVGAIGKHLTPSFQLSDGMAAAYVDGVRHHSKVTRLSFSEPVRYVVARPGWQVLGQKEAESVLPEEPQSAGDETVMPVALTAAMLSTNAPSNYPATEDLDKLLDGDLNTIFHSTWGTGAYEKLGPGETPYIDVQLPEPLHTIQFSYTTRNSSGRHPLSLCIWAGNSSNSLKEVRTFTLDDGMPTEPLATFQSPTIDLGGDCRYLRVEQTACAYRSNYLAWAEFALFQVTKNEVEEHSTDPGDTADSDQLMWHPYGRSYRVTVDWPADRASMTPAVYINTENGVMVSSKDYYLNATIRLDGAGIFPDMEETEVLIKGRGNSSWSSNAWAKNPYRLKFAEKQKPFGLTKGKSWVLQANAQSGSMMVNAIGMKAAHLMQAAAANHVVPVELYMNGSYRGSYIFNEKIGFANNSIELADESAATLLELDTYYDETYRFHSTYYYLPVNIKEPDFTDAATATQLTSTDIQRDFNQFVTAMMNGDELTDWVDVNYLASFLSVNELVGNYELMHPKSVFLYKENLFGDSRYIFGPIWDLDWAFGYESSHQYATSGINDQFYTLPQYTFDTQASQFWKALRYSSEAVDRAYYLLWTRFMEHGGLEELLAFCDEYLAVADPSFRHNAQIWSDGYNYATNTERMKKWLQQRAQVIYGSLTPYDLTGLIDLTEYWTESESSRDNDEPEEIGTDISELQTIRPTRFTVYDLRGVLLKRDAAFGTWRDGLKPGIYLVNGKKVLVR